MQPVNSHKSEPLPLIRRAQIVLAILALPWVLGVVVGAGDILTGKASSLMPVLLVGVGLVLLGGPIFWLQRGSVIAWRYCSALGVLILPAIPIGTVLGLILLRALDRQEFRDFCGVGGKQHFKD